MHPVVEFSIGEWHAAISSYRLMLLVALVLTIAVTFLVAGHMGIRRTRLAVVLALAGAGAIAGARLLAVVTTRSDGQDLAERLRHLATGDFALYGGLIGGGLVGLAACKLIGLNPLRTADALAPAIGMGIVSMRVGCLLAGCCFGNPTNLPWGITYPNGSPAHLHQIVSGDSLFAALDGPQPVHPIPIYDMGAALVGALIAGFAIRRGWRKGTAMALFVVWYSAWRLLLRPLRADIGASIMPGWFWPAMFLGALLAAGLWLVIRRPTPVPAFS
jgi:phosphatidylglycerol:prolipoprotein diacylglycerol transferase